MSNAALDKKILLPTIAIVLLTSAPLIFYASSLQGMIQSIYDFTAKSFGWGYILLYLLGGFFVFFIAFSPYGKIKLGGHDQKPVFNNFHWGSMIIAAGHGIGMVNWSMVEPLITNNAAPLGHGANAAYSYEVATAYTFFHWGPYYWVLYLIPCIPIFYFMGVRQVKKQRVSECLTPLFGRKLIDGWFGVCLDVFIIMGLAGGIGSTLATAVQLVSGLYADYFGLPDTQALHLGVLGMFTVITLGSIRKPLSKGMRLLSDMNSILALSLLAIVLIGGATGYFFSLGTNTLGMVLDMFPRVSGWTDPFNASGFPAKWTVFYGAWFLAYGPMMAIFFTGISMGRTLRETVLGVYFFGCLSSFLFSVIFGGFSLYLQYTGQFDVYAFYLANGLPNTVSKVVSLTLLHQIMSPAFLICCTIFLTTTIDAATRVMASMSSKEILSDQNPASLQSTSGAFLFHTRLGRPACRRAGNHPSTGRFGRHPLLGICVIMNISMFKAVREDFPNIWAANLLYIDKEKSGGKA
ncbi:MAG: BCCT family transporter [Bilophila wadsworthia]